ncbi:MAG TPA: hypothetical protein VGK19_04705 [Capsulimonadaceae bacterium]|jgi:hypothetical protein
MPETQVTTIGRHIITTTPTTWELREGTRLKASHITSFIAMSSCAIAMGVGTQMGVARELKAGMLIPIVIVLGSGTLTLISAMVALRELRHLVNTSRTPLIMVDTLQGMMHSLGAACTYPHRGESIKLETSGDHDGWLHRLLLVHEDGETALHIENSIYLASDWPEIGKSLASYVNVPFTHVRTR